MLANDLLITSLSNEINAIDKYVNNSIFMSLFSLFDVLDSYDYRNDYYYLMMD